LFYSQLRTCSNASRQNDQISWQISATSGQDVTPERFAHGQQKRRPIFPLQELYITIVLLALIAAGLYYLGGAWGVVLLWALGVMLLLPILVAPLGLFQIASERAGERRWLHAGLYLCGAMLAGAGWLVAVGYTAYRAYRALP